MRIEEDLRFHFNIIQYVDLFYLCMAICPRGNESGRPSLCSCDNIFDLLESIIRQWLWLVGFDQLASARIHPLFEGQLIRVTPSPRSAPKEQIWVPNISEV